MIDANYAVFVLDKGQAAFIQALLNAGVNDSEFRTFINENYVDGQKIAVYADTFTRDFVEKIHQRENWCIDEKCPKKHES